MNKITLYWGDRNDTVFRWYQPAGADVSDKPIPMLESHELLKADLAALADTLAGKKVELVVASQDVHINSVELPNKAQRHLRKAVPFLLEEQIADSVDDIFVAVGNRQANGKIPVRGIQLAYLEQLVAEFKAAEIKLDVIYVELDLLEAPEEGMRVMLSQQQAFVVDDDDHRWACEQDLFSWLIQKQLAADEDEEAMPVAIPLMVTCESQDAFTDFENALPAGRFAAQMELVESIEKKLLESTASPINLLQGEFEPKKENSALKNMLLKVASISAIVLTAWVVYQGTNWYGLNAQYEHLKAERLALAKQAFPGRKIEGREMRTLNAFLKSQGAAGSDNGFLELLDSSTGQIQDLAQLYPTNISYNAARNEIRLDLVAKDLPVLNQYRDQLKSSGHEVDMSSATQRGEGYSSRLTIRRN